MAKLDDLTGKIFGRLSVLRRVPNGALGYTKWECLCSCGRTCIVIGGNLRVGQSKSCGCWYLETRGESNKSHGSYKAPEYVIWKAMKQRCCNPNSTAYKHYGGRGIAICSEWIDDFERFYRDMGKKPSPRHEIERRGVNGNYEPDNCEWATRSAQMRNIRELDGKQGNPGCRGVVWDKRRSRWVARLKLHGKTINLGRFDVLEDAIAARKAGEALYWKETP